MSRESLEAKKERTAKIIAGLKKAYPNAHCELNYSNPLELLIATILSAQCTDKQVNIVTENLFKKFRNAAAFANASLPELEQDIRRIGFFRNKAKNIQACCKSLLEKHGGEVPKTMKQLTSLAGVGRKTANVVLGNAFNINVGIVVDTHVARLSERLDFSRLASPEKIELDLQKLVPQNDWTPFSHLLIWHGRRRCFARNPDCLNCEVKHLCPAGKKRLSAIISRKPFVSETKPANSKVEKPMSEAWLLLQSGAGESAWNMALDETLLESSPQIAKPILRFYSWTEPAGSFGYSQRFKELERITHLRPLIRRPTGGGLVPHDGDWTYSLIFSPNHSWYELKAAESYQRIHEWIRDAFQKMDVATELSPCCKKEIPGQCFVGMEKSDLLWHERKIAGAAQRRTKSGLLIQGSVQPPPISLPRSDWEKSMCVVACESFGATWNKFIPDADLNARASALAQQKYSQPSYNQKR